MAFSCLKTMRRPWSALSSRWPSGLAQRRTPGEKSMGSLWQRHLVGHILRHLHSKSLLRFWVCEVPPAPNYWTIDLGPTQGSQYHCFARRWAFLRATLAGSKMQQNLRTSQGARRQAVEPQAGSQPGRHMVRRSCAQAAEDNPFLENPSLDSGFLGGPSQFCSGCS
jgi:hypothetical protein